MKRFRLRPWHREVLFLWAAHHEIEARNKRQLMRAEWAWAVASATDMVQEDDPLDVKASTQWGHVLASKVWSAWLAFWLMGATLAGVLLYYRASGQPLVSIAILSLPVVICASGAGLCAWMLSMIPNYDRGDDYINQASLTLRRRQVGQRKAEEARHAENREMRQMVLDWWTEHKEDPGMTKDKAAEAIADKLVPLKFRTVRDYLKGV